MASKNKKAPEAAPLGPVRVFVSWSKPASKIVAEKLRTWLPTVIQALEVFVSSKDIEKGVRWRSEIDSQLVGADFGIVCLTPENAASPWIHFEGGALAKAVQGEEVDPPLFTFLIGLRHADVRGPLAEFQHTLATKEDTRALLHSLNATLARVTGRGLPRETVDSLFDQFWPQLEEAIAAATKSAAPGQLRSAEDMLAEVLDQVRSINQRLARRGPSRVIAQAIQERFGFDPDVDQEISPVVTLLGWERVREQVAKDLEAAGMLRERALMTIARAGKEADKDEK